MNAKEMAEAIMDIISNNSPFDIMYGDAPGEMLDDLEKKIGEFLAGFTGEEIEPEPAKEDMVEVPIYMEERDGRDGFYAYLEMTDGDGMEEVYPLRKRLSEGLDNDEGDGSKYRFLYLPPADLQPLLDDMNREMKRVADENDFTSAGDIQYSIGFLKDAIREL